MNGKAIPARTTLQRHTARVALPSYRAICIASAAIAGVLTVCYLFVPSLVSGLFGIPGGASVDLMAGRAGVLFAALGLIYWGLRDSDQPTVRIAVLRSSALAMGAMLAFGLWHIGRGFAGPGHLVATAAELTYFGLFVLGWRRERAGR